MGHRNAGILVVDDQEDIRDLLKDHLEDQGYGCHTASSCDGAMQVLATESVDLAMLDIIMPGTTGLKLFQEIREAHPDIAVIFVTAMSDVNFAVGNIKNGAYDYLVKPVSRKHLLEAVEQTLSKREDLLKKRQNQLWLQESVKKSISEYLHGHVQSKLLVSSGPHHQDSGEAKIRESTAGVSRKPSSDGKARGSSSKHLIPSKAHWRTRDSFGVNHCWDPVTHNPGLDGAALGCRRPDKPQSRFWPQSHFGMPSGTPPRT